MLLPTEIHISTRVKFFDRPIWINKTYLSINNVTRATPARWVENCTDMLLFAGVWGGTDSIGSQGSPQMNRRVLDMANQACLIETTFIDSSFRVKCYSSQNRYPFLFMPASDSNPDTPPIPIESFGILRCNASHAWKGSCYGCRINGSRSLG